MIDPNVARIVASALARALALASAFSQAWAHLGAVFPALPPLPELSDLLR